MAEPTPPINRTAIETDALSRSTIAKVVNIEAIISDSVFRTAYKNFYRDLTVLEKVYNSENQWF